MINTNFAAEKAAALSPEANRAVEFDEGKKNSKSAFPDAAPSTEVVATDPAPQAKPENKETAPADDGDENGQDKNGVPYPRFQKVFTERTEYKIKADLLQKQLDDLKSNPVVVAPAAAPAATDPTTLPDWWVKLYGNDAVSHEAYKGQLAHDAEFEERVFEKLTAKQRAELEEQKQVEEELDETFTQLETSSNRTLTEDERKAVLTVVDEFTPKDAKGDYKGEIFPLDKALEIYDLRKGAVKAPINQERRGIAALAAGGRTSQVTSKDPIKPFVPGQWDGWKDAEVQK